MQSGPGIFINDSGNKGPQTTLYSPDHHSPDDEQYFDENGSVNTKELNIQALHPVKTTSNSPMKTISVSPEQINCNPIPSGPGHNTTDGGATESYTFYQETLNSFRGPSNPIQNFQASFQA